MRTITYLIGRDAKTGKFIPLAVARLSQSHGHRRDGEVSAMRRAGSIMLMRYLAEDFSILRRRPQAWKTRAISGSHRLRVLH